MSEAAQLPMAEPVDRRTFLGRRKHVVSFPELVLAHFLRQQELYERKAPGPAEQRYRRYVEAFEAAHGRILDVYWCSHEVSAVCLTAKRRAFPLRLVKSPQLRIHRVSDWATRYEPELAKALHDCDTLAVKIGTVLRDTSQRVAMHWVFALMSYLLGVVDSTKGRVGATERRGAIKAFTAERARIEQYYKKTAVRGAQIVYFWGMVIGAVVMGVLGLAAWPIFFAADVGSETLKQFYACFVAGGTGAFVSVIQRVTSGHFTVDFELGRGAIRRLGSFRPFLGAVFGVMIFFVVESGIIQTSGDAQGFHFLVILAFVAGFSERFAKDILDEAAGTVAPADAPATEPGGKAQPIPASEAEEIDVEPVDEYVPEAEGELDTSTAEGEGAPEGEAIVAEGEEVPAEDGVPAGIR